MVFGKSSALLSALSSLSSLLSLLALLSFALVFGYQYLGWVHCLQLSMLQWFGLVLLGSGCHWFLFDLDWYFGVGLLVFGVCWWSAW